MEPTTEPTTPRRNPLPLLMAGALLLLMLLVKWCNTPHQDSSEKPLPKPQVKVLLQDDKKLQAQIEHYKHKADSAESASDRAYARGVQDAKEAIQLHQQSRHASPVTRSASAAELQSILSKYGDKNF